MTTASVAPKSKKDRRVMVSPSSPDKSQSETTFRFSGHQTFPLRITWIPKAAREIVAGLDPLTNIDYGITKLGLGKNMVEALRCWIEAFQIASRVDGKWLLSSIGELIFHPEGGLDPYLEDVCTSWLLHWQITTNTKAPFFAWECVFNRWPAMEFTASQILEAFENESNRMPKPGSLVTLRQHWEVFLHSYRPPRSDKGEDHLDSAMSPLRLIREFGERQNASGKYETIYSFDSSPKSAVPEQLFVFFVHDWWNRQYPKEHTVPLREMVLGDHSPGRVLKMEEPEILQRLTSVVNRQPKIFQIRDSLSSRILHRLQHSTGISDLKAAYKTPNFL